MKKQAPAGGCSVREAGRRGGVATAAKHGLDFYEKIGKKGGQRTKELIEAGKRAIAEKEKAEAE